MLEGGLAGLVLGIVPWAVLDLSWSGFVAELDKNELSEKLGGACCLSGLGSWAHLGPGAASGASRHVMCGDIILHEMASI